MTKTTDLDVGYVSKLARLRCALSVNWSASPLGKGERGSRQTDTRPCTRGYSTYIFDNG